MSEAKPRALEVADALSEFAPPPLLMTRTEAAALLRQQHAAIVELREALTALVDRNFTFFSGGMVGADRKITKDEVWAARATLTNTEGLRK